MDRIAKLTHQGIMVNAEKMYKLGPVNGAIATILNCFDNSEKLYAVQYDGCKPVHLVIDPPNDDMYVYCGLPAEGEATMWKLDHKKITCKKCMKAMQSK